MAELHKILGYIKNTSVGIFYGIFVMLAFALLYPTMMQKVVPLLLESPVALSKGEKGYTLTPILNSNNTEGEIELGQAYWNAKSTVLSSSHTNIDIRAKAIEIMLIENDSPLASYANVFVEAADKAGLDWRLVVSISGVESAFGRLIPPNSYNGWGWKGGPDGDFSKFSSWEEAIRHVTERIAVGYGTSTTPYRMESVYCPPCGATGMHYWTNGVEMYMRHLDLILDDLKSNQ